MGFLPPVTVRDFADVTFPAGLPRVVVDRGTAPNETVVDRAADGRPDLTVFDADPTDQVTTNVRIGGDVSNDDFLVRSYGTGTRMILDGFLGDDRIAGSGR